MTTLYLTEPGTVVSVKNQSLDVKRGSWQRSCRLTEIELVVVLPGVQLTGAAIALLLDSGVETLFLRRDGRFRGRLQGQFHSNPSLRLAQYRVVETTFGMGLAQKVVLGKIRNQRSLLQRHNRETGGRVTALVEAVDTMAVYLRQLQRLETPLSRDQLMGIEGICAKTYFQGMMTQIPGSWGFTGRNRRPPRDPVNALLSWGYGVLLARVFSASVQAGLDPYLGFFHATEPYRPNLVLDLIEEFRPLVVDWVVWRFVRSSVLDRQDFEPSPDGEGVWLGHLTKKLFFDQLDRLFQSKILYPPLEGLLALSQFLLEQGRAIGRACIGLRLDEFESLEVR